MGGRGGASGGSAKSSSAGGMFGREKPLKVETRYIEGRGFTRGRYDDTVLQAVSLGDGKVELQYAKADSYNKTAKTNKTNYVTYTLDHGFVNDTPHNINFEKITSFTGQTYAVKEALKKRGYKFRNGGWVKE